MSTEIIFPKLSLINNINGEHRMFINNKYSVIYYNIINRAVNRVLTGYKEKHHIIPRSFGGSNDKTNLVNLTAREHYLAHWLLTKMCTSEYKSKMLYAFWRMNNNKKYRFNSRAFETIKLQNAKSHSNNMSGKNNPFYGKKHTTETIQAITEQNKQWKWDDAHKLHFSIIASGEKNGMYGKRHTAEAITKMKNAAANRTVSQETKDKISKAFKGKKPNTGFLTCPYCSKYLDSGNAKRHHFDNCKLNPLYVIPPKRTYNKVKI